MIEAVSLTKKYGPVTALSGVSFHIEPGEVVGLLGPNGAGKTTTMRILTGYMPPTSGEVRISGIDILKNPSEAKKRIGYLPENPPLYPELTVEEHLYFVGGLHKISSPKQKIESLLKKTGLSEVRKRLVENISKGYRQRLGIAGALIHEPEVLILDEPTIGLDPKQILEIRRLIRDLEGQPAVVFSSHILQEVGTLCDRIIIIHQGRIVADGKVSELTRQKRRWLVTASDDGASVEELLKQIPGITEVKAHPTDLEELFIQLTAS